MYNSQILIISACLYTALRFKCSDSDTENVLEVSRTRRRGSISAKLTPADKDCSGSNANGPGSESSLKAVW